MSILVIDVGTSGLRAAVVRPDSTVVAIQHRPTLPSTPFPGLVEFDATSLAETVIEVAQLALAEAGPVAAVGIATQRASTIVWERATGRPVAPAQGWQDLRTVGRCLEMQAQGFRFAPNASATKLADILQTVDPDRRRSRNGELAFGTVDSWVVWTLTKGSRHVIDASNAGVTGLLTLDASTWSEQALTALNIPRELLPEIVDSSGALGEASALPGSPVISGVAGDQQASLVGQGCLAPGLAKATFGTGGMLDLCTGALRPQSPVRGPSGTIPIVAWRRGGSTTWGVEALMLSAGSCVEWLRDDLGIIAAADDSETVAAQCATTGDVWFVPALLGMGTPVWDFGARGTYLGLTRGSGRPELVRAVLEGVAHRGADLLDAAEGDAGLAVNSLRIDGGMSVNGVFIQSLADAIGRPVEVSPVTEATTLGAAYLAGLQVGTWASEDDVMATWRPRQIVEPSVGDDVRAAARTRWLDARSRAERTIPELSGVDF